MSSGNAVRSRLSLILVAVMILPTVLSISQLGTDSQELEDRADKKLSLIHI